MKKLILIFAVILLFSQISYGQQRPDPVPGSQKIMKFYPNPAVSFIKFEFQKSYERGYTLQVVNFIGRQVTEKKNISSSTTIDLSSFNRGIYIYQLIDPYGKVAESGKFQVAR